MIPSAPPTDCIILVTYRQADFKVCDGGHAICMYMNFAKWRDEVDPDSDNSGETEEPAGIEAEHMAMSLMRKGFGPIWHLSVQGYGDKWTACGPDMDELRLLFSHVCGDSAHDWESRDGVRWSWPGGGGLLENRLPKGWDDAKYDRMLRSWAADISWVIMARLAAAAPPGSVEEGHKVLQAFRDHGLSAESICDWIMDERGSPFEFSWAY